MNGRVTPLSSILVPFFNTLEKEKLPYCVCGNYERLPEFTSHDVDIWVENAEKAERLLRSIAKRQGFKVHLNYRTGVGTCIFLHKFMDDGNVVFIRIDLMSQCAWLAAFPLVRARDIEKNRKKFRIFYIPDPPVEASMQLLYPLISGGKVKDKYKARIFTWRNHPTFINVLNQAVGRKQTDKLIKQIEAKDWGAIEKNVRKLRLSIIWRFVRTINVKQILGLLNAFKCYISRFIHPKGVFVAFIGPDGTGKTTLCKKIPVILQRAFLPGRSIRFYWRPMLLPPLRRFLSIFRIKTRDEFTTNNDAKSPHNLFISVICFIYYWLDFVIGQVKFRSVWANGGIVCFDRYYHEFFVYPQRFGLILPRWLLRIFMPFVPQPDLIFYLHAPLEVLLSRKRENSRSELERQLNLYDTLVSSFSNIYRIDASKPLDEVVRLTMSNILNFMADREGKRNEDN